MDLQRILRKPLWKRRERIRVIDRPQSGLVELTVAGALFDFNRFDRAPPGDMKLDNRPDDLFIEEDRRGGPLPADFILETLEVIRIFK